jgi:hypothetical protein
MVGLPARINLGCRRRRRAIIEDLTTDACQNTTKNCLGVPKILEFSVAKVTKLFGCSVRAWWLRHERFKARYARHSL